MSWRTTSRERRTGRYRRHLVGVKYANVRLVVVQTLAPHQNVLWFKVESKRAGVDAIAVSAS
jgi:hypothetical protein